MNEKIHLLFIDPQNDFMDVNHLGQPGPLAVPGATDDAKRSAELIRRIGKKVDDIHITLDSHRIIDIAHPAMWIDQNGNPPDPFVTMITADDIRAGIWTPRAANGKPSALGGKTIREYALWYTEELARKGNYPLIIWAPHCLIGTPGHAVQGDLAQALQEWESVNLASVDYVTKGTNVWTEHYGALEAEVPMASDPTTSLNSDLLNMLQTADIIAVGGQALSHCVKTTVTQIADNIGDEHISKFHILRDCTSPIPKIGDGPDFPAIAEDWLKEMEKRGMHITTSVDFLA